MNIKKNFVPLKQKSPLHSTVPVNLDEPSRSPGIPSKKSEKKNVPVNLISNFFTYLRPIKFSENVNDTSTPPTLTTQLRVRSVHQVNRDRTEHQVKVEQVNRDVQYKHRFNDGKKLTGTLDTLKPI